MRRLAKVVAALLAAVVVVVVALVLLLQSGAVSRRVKDLVLPRASAALGREVTVRDARIRLVPGPRVDLVDTTVAGRPGEPALVQLAAFEVSLRLWPLLRSLGRDVEVESIRLARPVINLVRAADGTWNYEGLGKGGAERAPSPSPAPAQPPAAADRTLVVDHAAIEDGEVRLIDATRPGGGGAVAISRIDVSADHVGVGQPLQAKLSAALVGPDRNLTMDLHADRLPAGVADLGPGKYPRLDGALQLAGLDLGRLRAFLPPSVTGMMTGGRVDADAKLSTASDGYHVDGGGRLDQVRLRGEPASGSFDLHAVADPATSAFHARIEKLVLKGPGMDLGGNASVSSSGGGPHPAPTRVRFAIAGPLLDLGQLMGLLPPSAPKPAGGPLVTAEQRQLLQTLDVAGTIDIAKVVKGALVATDFKASAVLDHGAFLLRDASAGFFGGRVDASGTRVDLAPEVPRWALRTKLRAVDLGQALGALAGSAPLTGKLQGELSLDGAGVDWPTLRNALTGEGAVAVQQGALATADIGDQVLGSVAQGLRAVGKGGAANAVAGTGGKTDIRDLAARFTVKDGMMTLSQPLSFTAPFGKANLGGRVGLDGKLGLQGTATLPKEVLARLLGPTGIPAPASLDVPLAIGGTLEAPSVSVSAQEAAASLAKGAAKQQVQKLQNRATDEARKGLGGFLRGLGGK
jgi:AsmA protein